MFRYLANFWGRRKQTPEIAGTSCVLEFDNPEGEPGEYKGLFNTEKYFDLLKDHFEGQTERPNISFSDGEKHHYLDGSSVTGDVIDTDPPGTLACFGHEYIEDCFTCEGCPFYRTHQKAPE